MVMFLLQYGSFNKLYEVRAHTNEIDDLDISPSGDKVSLGLNPLIGEYSWLP